jgi:tripartite-type tricarboxylate transporter receptor subunit TctC
MNSLARKLLGLAAASTIGLLPMVASAHADYPNKPIRLVLGVAPGGLIDV